jgi:hypothetical protein
MIHECFKACLEIMFESKCLCIIGFDPSILHPDVKPKPLPLPAGSQSYHKVIPKKPLIIRCLLSFLRSLGKPAGAATSGVCSTESALVQMGLEEEEDLEDPPSPIYDQLELKHTWWILEFLPLKFPYHRGNKEWMTSFIFLRPVLSTDVLIIQFQSRST